MCACVRGCVGGWISVRQGPLHIPLLKVDIMTTQFFFTHIKGRISSLKALRVISPEQSSSF